MARDQSTIQNKCYRPSDELVDLMQGLHNLEVERIELEKGIKAGTISKVKAVEKEENLRRKEEGFGHYEN